MPSQKLRPVQKSAPGLIPHCWKSCHGSSVLGSQNCADSHIERNGRLIRGDKLLPFLFKSCCDFVLYIVRWISDMLPWIRDSYFIQAVTLYLYIDGIRK